MFEKPFVIIDSLDEADYLYGPGDDYIISDDDIKQLKAGKILNIFVNDEYGITLRYEKEEEDKDMKENGTRCYGIIDMDFETFEKLIGIKDNLAGTVFISTDINEIREWFDGIERRTGKKRDPKNYTIELYWVDEEGDYLDGSDYDPADRFLEVGDDV